MFQYKPQNYNPSYFEKDQVVLQIWCGTYELASIDPISIEAMLLLQINMIPYEIYYCRSSMLNKIPSATWKGITVTNGPEFINFIGHICNPDIDSKYIQNKTLDRIKLLKRIFLDRFVKAFTYECWLREKNFKEFILPWFKDNIIFPFGEIYAEKTKEKISNQFLYELRLSKLDQNHYTFKLHADADNCLIHLNDILSDGRTFFLGRHVTSFDVKVYSYLMVSIRLPLPETYLKNTIETQMHLLHFLEDMQMLFKFLPRAKPPSFTFCLINAIGYYFKYILSILYGRFNVFLEKVYVLITFVFFCLRIAKDTFLENITKFCRAPDHYINNFAEY